MLAKDTAGRDGESSRRSRIRADSGWRQAFLAALPFENPARFAMDKDVEPGDGR
jgi:hypothetical protein